MTRTHFGHRLHDWFTIALCALGVVAMGSCSAAAEVEYVLENYNHLLTYQDCGFNQFGGNTGGFNSDHLPKFAVCDKQAKTHRFDDDSADGPGRALRLAFDFPPGGGFFGIFHSLAGLTKTEVTFDGTTVITLPFPAFTINLDHFFGAHDGEARVGLDVLRFRTKHKNAAAGLPYRLRISLKDAMDREAVHYADVQPINGWQTHAIPLANFPPPGGPVDRNRIKVLVIQIERFGPGFENPAHVDVLLDSIVFVDSDGTPDQFSGMADRDFLSLIARRTFTYFLDYLSRDPRSAGIPQDRSTLNDLLTAGGLGFSLSALCLADAEGWIRHDEAVTRVHQTLSILADDSRQSPRSKGAIGYRGFFYHFLNVDGHRKLNFDRPETPELDESLNTIELSTIDTTLALMGVIAAKQHFRGDSPEERRIRAFADHILWRVEWPFMLRTAPLPARKRHQFYLGWKPNERRADEPRFEIADAEGLGAYSGRLMLPDCPEEEAPATLDFYTDEALLVALLAMASPNPAHRLGKEVWDAVWRGVEPADGPFVKSFPGSLFTYFFASSWIDWRFLGRDAHPTLPVDWYLNNQTAIRRAFDSTAARADPTCGTAESPDGSGPNRFCTYTVGPVGLTAAEGPDDRYRAYTDSTVAIHTFGTCGGRIQQAFHMDDGTVAPYGAGASILYVPRDAILALRAYQNVPGVWHPRFAYADAFNFDAAFGQLQSANNLCAMVGVDAAIDYTAFIDGAAIRLSPARPWVNAARFAIDQGPLLLTIHNYLTQTERSPGYVQSLIMNDPDIRRTLETVYPTQFGLPGATEQKGMLTRPVDWEPAP